MKQSCCFVRSGALNASLTSVYPDKEAFERSAPIRKERMKAHKDMITGVYVTEGAVALMHLKNREKNLSKLINYKEFNFLY